MDIFVKPQDDIEVEVYAWEDKENGNLTASNEASDAPKDVEVQIVKCRFRKPTYQDSNTILRTASITGTTSQPDVMSFQDAVIRSLLLEVTFNGETTDMRQAKINSLNPHIARAAVAAVLLKVSL